MTETGAGSRPAAEPEHRSTLPSSSVADLLDVLDLHELGESRVRYEGVPGDEETDLGEFSPTVFLGRSQKTPHGRVFGGQVLAQSIVAAARTVAPADGLPRRIHSLHAYFVRGGDDSHPIRFLVEKVRDGGSFSTRRVQAVQYGRTILSVGCSFQQEASGLDHHDPMPPVPFPEDVRTLDESMSVHGLDADPAVQAYLARDRPIEMRHVEGDIYVRPGRNRIARQNLWLRAKGTLPDDPVIHAAVLAYASDYPLLEPVLRRHGIHWMDRRLRPASLDHTMWFHRAVRADDWILYTMSSPSASGGRGLGVGRMFTQDGALVATLAQEGMLRLKDTPRGEFKVQDV
jgi:acyl-CoA thioesterase-2